MFRHLTCVRINDESEIFVENLNFFMPPFYITNPCGKVVNNFIRFFTTEPDP